MTDPVRTILDTAIDMAREAGRLLMNKLSVGLRAPEDIEDKGGRELVTEIDRESERLIVSQIHQTFPGHDIIGEEETLESSGDEWRWIIDPLDGTTNYIHGHPMFCVSIGVEKAGQMECAVIHLPYLDETFYAQRGKGAYLNSDTIRLSVSHIDDLSNAILATGFAYHRDRYPNYANFDALVREARGIRRCGSAAIDLCFVAAGRYDGYWELGLRPWDVAAGSLLVQEAGGRITDTLQGDQWLTGRALIASNGRIHADIAQHLEPFQPETDAT